MNKTLIFIKIVFLAFNSLISTSFSLFEVPFKLVWYDGTLRFRVSFNVLQAPLAKWQIFNLGSEKNRSKYGNMDSTALVQTCVLPKLLMKHIHNYHWFIY